MLCGIRSCSHDSGTPMGVGAGDLREGKAKPSLYRELFVVFVSSVHRRSVTCLFRMPMNVTV